LQKKTGPKVRGKAWGVGHVLKKGLPCEENYAVTKKFVGHGKISGKGPEGKKPLQGGGKKTGRNKRNFQNLDHQTTSKNGVQGKKGKRRVEKMGDLNTNQRKNHTGTTLREPVLAGEVGNHSQPAK